MIIKLSLLILTFCIVQLVCGQGGYHELQYDVKALREFDDYIIDSCLTPDGQLPDTADEIVEYWCRNALSKHLYLLGLLERAFEHNIALVNIFRLSSFSKIRDVHRMCRNRQILPVIAMVLRVVNKYLPQLMTICPIAKNTYLHVVDPRSGLTATHLVCFMKKFMAQIFGVLPPTIQKAFMLDQLRKFKQKLPIIKLIVHLLHIDTNFNDCPLPRRRADNPLGIRSDITALLMAFDKVSTYRH
ncbi:uncharacterized protein LOC128952645 [Oppia nitens]|uniref:uncharacterized protein LOC128952645 n=1 Tax=Oppia nitens TaxID=1686743 RepID=UPI0023DC0FA7|nr:uncharacterized protein LOC128952645 [Oppia nitens]